MKTSTILSRMSKALAITSLAAALYLPTSLANGTSIFELAGSSYTADHAIFESSPIFGDNNQKVDLIGGDITFGSTGSTAGGIVFTLGGAYGTFDMQTDPNYIPGGNGSINANAEDNHVALAHAMIGYRYSHKLSSSISIYLGTHFGISAMGIAPTGIIINSPTTGEITHFDDSYDYDISYTYVLEAGVSVNLTETLYIFASYQYITSDATPEVKLGTGESIKTKAQSYQTIRAGLGFSF